MKNIKEKSKNNNTEANYKSIDKFLQMNNIIR